MENHHPQNRKGRVVSSHQRPHLPNNDTPPTEPRGEARRRGGEGRLGELDEGGGGGWMEVRLDETTGPTYIRTYRAA